MDVCVKYFERICMIAQKLGWSIAVQILKKDLVSTCN